MDQPSRNRYQAFLERHRNSLPKENREATMSLITDNLKLMEGNSLPLSGKLIAQSEEIARKRFHLRPVPEFRTLADVYQKLVLVNGNFSDTRRMFNNLKGDPLSLDVFEDEEKTVATITIGRITLAQVEEGPITGLTRKKWLTARNRIIDLVRKQFMSSMEKHCYSLYEKENPNTTVESKYSVGRRTARDSDELDLKYYRHVLKRFMRNDCGIDLVVCEKLTKIDRVKLMETVHDLRLRGKFSKMTGQVTIFSRCPSVEIVHDIIHRKHPDLCAMYDVEPPRGSKTNQPSEPKSSIDQVFSCGSLKYALSEAASIVEGYKLSSLAEAAWIAHKLL